MFYYLIDLHYSQTQVLKLQNQDIVLLPYRFTLFSNLLQCQHLQEMVLLPYRFTLFSNYTDDYDRAVEVLLPYRFTLFSNLKPQIGNKMHPLYYARQIYKVIL